MPKRVSTEKNLPRFALLARYPFSNPPSRSVFGTPFYENLTGFHTTGTPPTLMSAEYRLRALFSESIPMKKSLQFAFFARYLLIILCISPEGVSIERLSPHFAILARYPSLLHPASRTQVRTYPRCLIH